MVIPASKSRKSCSALQLECHVPPVHLVACILRDGACFGAGGMNLQRNLTLATD